MPYGLFWSRARMLPRLEAEEAQAVVAQVRAATSARFQEDSRQRYETGLQKTAALSGRPPRASRGQLAEMGIEMVTEPGVHPGWAALEQASSSTQTGGEVT